MQLTKEYINRYFQRILDKRKFILSTIEKHPIIGVDISKLDKKEKLYLGGIRKLSIEIDQEILSLHNFILGIDSDYFYTEDVKNTINEIEAKHLQLFDIEGDSIKFNKNVDDILKDIK